MKRRVMLFIGLVIICFTASLAISLRWKALAQGGPATFTVGTSVSYHFDTLKYPTGLFLGLNPGGLDPTLYIADSSNHVIRMFDATKGTLSVLAGTVGNSGYVNGTTSSALFNNPTGLTGFSTYGTNPSTGRFYSYTYLYVGDSLNYVVRNICTGILYSGSSCSTVQTSAGNSTQGYLNGGSASAEFSYLAGISTSSSGQYYVADTGNSAVRVWDASANTVSTYAGTGTAGFVNGYRTSAQFAQPTRTALDTAGNVYIADAGNNVIRKIDTSGNVTTFAGSGTPGNADGNGSSAQFNMPCGIVYNPADNYLYVADSRNNAIRRIDLSGNVTTYAGEAGNGGYADGSLSVAQFSCPMDLVISGTTMFISDAFNNAIRSINMTSGTVSTYIS